MVSSKNNHIITPLISIYLSNIYFYWFDYKIYEIWNLRVLVWSETPQSLVQHQNFSTGLMPLINNK